MIRSTMAARSLRTVGGAGIGARSRLQERYLKPTTHHHHAYICFPQGDFCRRTVVITKTSPSDPPPLGRANVGGSSNQSPSANTEASIDSNASNEMLTVTPSCIEQVHALLKRRGKTPQDMFLRVFVDAGGCSGFSYKFEMDDELIEDDDLIFADASGARVVVDKSSLQLIRGSKIDYVQEMIKSAFVVTDNPQSESACGCGSSFAVKNFAANPALD